MIFNTTELYLILGTVSSLYKHVNINVRIPRLAFNKDVVHSLLRMTCTEMRAHPKGWVAISTPRKWGAVAHMVERSLRMREVPRSILGGSIIFF